MTNERSEVRTPIYTPDGRELEEVRGWCKDEAGSFYQTSHCTWRPMSPEERRFWCWLKFFQWEYQVVGRYEREPDREGR